MSAARTVTPLPAEQVRDDAADKVRSRIALLSAARGKLNCVGDFSLAVAAATTTDLTDPLVTADSIVLVSPTNALAAAEPGMLVTYPSPGVARFTHTANAAARTFRYAVIG